MAKPPSPTQRRYRGNHRHNIRSIYNHMLNLFRADAKYVAKPLASYPNQLYDAGTRSTVNNVLVLLLAMLNATGPIPSR